VQGIQFICLVCFLICLYPDFTNSNKIRIKPGKLRFVHLLLSSVLRTCQILLLGFDFWMTVDLIYELVKIRQIFLMVEWKKCSDDSVKNVRPATSAFGIQSCRNSV
jgi:hypothetical protein